MRCAVYGCSVNNKSKNKSGNEISYHSFPKQTKMCKQWIFLCRRKDKINTKTARICGKHFKKSDFVSNPLYEQYGIVLKTTRIKEDAVPSLLLPKDERRQKDEEVTSPRDLRIQNRRSIPSVPVIVQDKKNIKLEVSAENLLLPNGNDCSTQNDASKVDCGTQVKQIMVDCSTQTDEMVPTYSQLLEQIAKLKAENSRQKKTRTK